MIKKALITGISGQDGRFLSSFLLAKGYEVIGLTRGKKSQENVKCFEKELSVKIEFVDMSCQQSLCEVLARHKPSEIYNLASQSTPSISWEKVGETVVANCIGTLNILEAFRKECPNSRFYHASSCQMFGAEDGSIQGEGTPFCPENPYAVTKVFAHQLSSIYRENYALFISNGIMFHHESEFRPLNFVLQKIAYGAACASLGLENSPHLTEAGIPIFFNRKLPMGNLDVKRDWGFAGDYVEAMWLMLQHGSPDDFIVASGHTHSIKEACEVAFRYVDRNWADYVVIDPKFFRSSESLVSQGDPQKANKVLGWKPKVNFVQLVCRMVDAQVEELKTSLG